jgi:hypothetical protein
LQLEKVETTSMETGFGTACLSAAFVHPWWLSVFFVVRKSGPSPGLSVPAEAVRWVKRPHQQITR